MLNTGNNNNEYKIEAIYDSIIYARELKSGHLFELYYLVFWKNYLEKENTWKLILAIWYLKKLINLFYKNYPDKLTLTFNIIDIALSMAKPIIKPRAIRLLKKERDQVAKSNKLAKKN